MDNFNIDIQIESNDQNIPSPVELIEWAQAALKTSEADITIRIVDEPESGYLNSTYRKKDGPTNVLSFPFDSPVDKMLQGDIVICAPIVKKEANTQNKPPRAHWAHLIVHGTLHLQGYDHITEEDAHVMEQLEIAILLTLDIPNPYD